MAWSTSTPVSGSKVLATPSIFQGNWTEMENIIEQEHYGMDNSLSGRHKPGYVGAAYVGTNDAITGLSSPFTGAVAIITSTGSGMGLIRGTSAWKRVHYDLPTTRVIVIGAASTITSGTTGFFLSGSTETVDTLSEWDATNGIFSGCGDGYFFFSGTLALSTTTTGSDSVTMGFSGSGISDTMTFTTDPSGYTTSIFSSIVSANSGVKVAPIITCPTHNISVSGGTGITYGTIYRIS